MTPRTCSWPHRYVICNMRWPHREVKIARLSSSSMPCPASTGQGAWESVPLGKVEGRAREHGGCQPAVSERSSSVLCSGPWPVSVAKSGGFKENLLGAGRPTASKSCVFVLLCITAMWHFHTFLAWHCLMRLWLRQQNSSTWAGSCKAEQTGLVCKDLAWCQHC